MSNEVAAAYKVCIFGDGGVGKSTLVRRYVTGAFEDDLKKSIGVDITMKKVDIKGRGVTLQIWDFAGEDRFRSLLPTYASGAHGGIFMYDITRLITLINIKDWIKIFRQITSRIDMKPPILLLGGKLDLEHVRSVTSDSVSQIWEKHNLDGSMECSAKTGQNVEAAFIEITRLIMTSLGII